MATRVSSEHLVGREAELARLEEALADATAERPSLAFLAGDSGVGKTRVLAELERRASLRGARVLSGDCVELGEGELPYAPLVAALRPLARDDDPVLREGPDAVRAELAFLLPELGTPALHVLEERTGSAQGRLFDALLALLDRLGRATPVVLALEDLHWADSSTRAFLVFLSGSLTRERLLVVGTLRADELHRRHPLRPVLAQIDRGSRAQRIELAPLNRAELGELLERVVGTAAGPDVADRLFARSEGNPLFAEELLAAGLDGRGELPPTLRDALMLRVERLSPPAQELLRVLAVAQRTDHALLAEASGLDPATLRAALREAVDGNLVVVGRDGRYAFRHALLREVVHDDLLPGEHAELHLEFARALERRAAEHGSGVHLAAAIAHHFQSAGDQPAAFAASVRAAEAAEQVHATGEAAGLLERALALWERVPDPEGLAGADRAELLVRAAAVHSDHGVKPRAVELLRAALAEVDESGRPQRIAGVLERLSRAQWGLGDPDESLTTARRALELLPEDDAGPERARLLAWTAKALMLESRYVETIPAARAAIETARVAGDAVAVSRALNALGVALIVEGELDEGTCALREAIAVAEAADRPLETAAAWTNLADTLHLAGRTREALAVAEEGHASEDPLVGGDRWLRLLVAELSFELGAWGRAQALIAEDDERPMFGPLRLNALLRKIELALGRGRHDRARELLDDAARTGESSREPQFHGPIGALRAELERRAGDLDAAREAIDVALGRVGREDVMRVARVAVTGLAVEADTAERARDLGDEPAVAAALERAERLLALAHGAALPGRPVEAAQLATAQAEATRARGASAPDAWSAAAAAWDALDRPYPAATASWRQAEAQGRAGDREGAAAAATAALTTAEALGADWLRGEVEGLAARARLALGPEGRPEQLDDAGDEDPFGLTPRERQVLALVAAGRTNREIGAALFMAEKTASVHVSRILAKLGVRRRTEAAGVAHRLGLDAATPR